MFKILISTLFLLNLNGNFNHKFHSLMLIFSAQVLFLKGRKLFSKENK